MRGKRKVPRRTKYTEKSRQFNCFFDIFTQTKLLNKLLKLQFYSHKWNICIKLSVHSLQQPNINNILQFLFGDFFIVFAVLNLCILDKAENYHQTILDDIHLKYFLKMITLPFLVNRYYVSGKYRMVKENLYTLHWVAVNYK